jgi:CheY-like chemotaxis protein
MVFTRKILIIDDDAGFCESILDILEARGYEAEAVNNGLAALAIVKTKTFDVIILDLKMPGMDGLETLQRIKNDTSKAEVFIVSAHLSQDLVEGAIRNGVRACFNKPLEIDKVVNFIEELPIPTSDVE